MLNVATENEFDFLSQEYALLRDHARATAFQHPIWLDRFYTHLPPNRNAEPLIVTLRENGMLKAVFPLIRRRKTGLILVETTDLGVSDYAAPIIHEDIVAHDRVQIVDRLREALGTYDILRIRPVREENCDDWQWIIKDQPIELDFSAHASELRSSFAEWRTSNLDASISGQTTRKLKKWNKQSKVELTLLTDRDEIQGAISKLAILRAGRFDGDLVQTDKAEKFYADVAQSGDDSFVQTWRLTSDNEVAGVLFGVTDRGRFLYLLIGCDYDGFGRYSPGLQMYDGIIKHWMEMGGNCFDFTIGDEPFKEKFGSNPTSMFAFIESGSLKGRVAVELMKRKLRNARAKVGELA